MRSWAGPKDGGRRIFGWRSDCWSCSAPSQQERTEATAFSEPALETQRKRLVRGWRNMIARSDLTSARVVRLISPRWGMADMDARVDRAHGILAPYPPLRK
jgi:hypothetical protein